MGFVRTILLAVHAFVVGLLLATLLNAFVPPKVFGYLNLLSLAFPVVLFIHFLLTIYWIISWKKRAFFFILVSILFYNPVKRWINYSPKESGRANLKVVTFNSKNGKYTSKETGRSVEDFINMQNADVIFLQENQLNDNSENYIQYPVVGLKTKHKILKHESLINNGSIGRAFYADIDINGKIMRFVNVYLEPFQLDKKMVKPTENVDVNKEKAKKLIYRLVPTFKKHQEQVKLIRKAVDHSPYPVILAGDFNSVPNSWEYFNLGSGLNDAFVEVGNGSATSFHDYKFPIRIDYIFASKNIKPISYRVDRSVKLSDHFPVTATFEY